MLEELREDLPESTAAASAKSKEEVGDDHRESLEEDRDIRGVVKVPDIQHGGVHMAVIRTLQDHHPRSIISTWLPERERIQSRQNKEGSLGSRGNYLTHLCTCNSVKTMLP